jgi:hypothetical protein
MLPTAAQPSFLLLFYVGRLAKVPQAMPQPVSDASNGAAVFLVVVVCVGRLAKVPQAMPQAVQFDNVERSSSNASMHSGWELFIRVCVAVFIFRRNPLSSVG